LANVLALTLWELLSTAEISSDNSNIFFSGTRNTQFQIPKKS
jgi:hypothetical protein